MSLDLYPTLPRLVALMPSEARPVLEVTLTGEAPVTQEYEGANEPSVRPPVVIRQVLFRSRPLGARL